MESILDAIGGSPLVPLTKLTEGIDATVHAKCEFLNPGGSARDRVARALVDHALKTHTLEDPEATQTIVVGTSGAMAISFAMVAAVKGLGCVAVVSDKNAPEQIASLRAFGARVVVCPDAVRADDSRGHLVTARKLADETANALLIEPHRDAENPAVHERETGPELYEQTAGALDVVVVGLETGGAATGIGRYLKSRDPNIKIVGVEPIGSLYFDLVNRSQRATTGSSKVSGIGTDFMPQTMDLSLIDEVVRVDDRTCFRTARALVRREGLYVGGSSGAIVAGALSYARDLPEGTRVVAILDDRAGSYLSTIFNDEWMRQHGFLDDDASLGTVADLLRAKGQRDIIVADQHDRVRDVVGRMKAHGISQLPVVGEGKLLGAVSEVDLLRILVSGQHALSAPVGPLVEDDYVTVARELRVEDLQDLLATRRMCIVVDEGAVVGVVTKIDLIDHLARRAV